MVSYSRKPPKYYCTICNKGFRRNKQYYNHVNRAHKNLGTKTKQVQQIVIEPELVSLKPEIEHSEPSTYENQYYGREYNYVNIPTGNRHLRAGIPLPRISKYERAAI